MEPILARAAAGSRAAEYEVGLACLGDKSIDIAAAEQWLTRSAAKNHDCAVELLAYLRASGTLPSIQTIDSKGSGDLAPGDRLMRYMRWLSEERWCAGWYEGLEYDLWFALDRPTFPYSLKVIAGVELATLRWLSRLADGWAIWSDDVREAVIVPLSDWNLMLKGQRESS